LNSFEEIASNIISNNFLIHKNSPYLALVEQHFVRFIFKPFGEDGLSLG